MDSRTCKSLGGSWNGRKCNYAKNSSSSSGGSKPLNIPWNTILLVAGLLLFGFIAYKVAVGELFTINLLTKGGGSTAPFTVSFNQPASNIDESLKAVLDLNPNVVCQGGFVKGSLETNMPGGVCSIYFNAGAGWTHFADVLLDSKGGYSSTQVMNTLGYALFKAVCFNGESYKFTNEEPLTVQVCGDSSDTKFYCCLAMGVSSCYEGGCPPAGQELGVYDTLASCQSNCGGSSDDESSYTCGVTSYCQSGTCPSGYFCDQVVSMQSAWCACINDQGEVHPDWKPDGDNYNPIVCSESDGGYSIFTKGSCNDYTGSYEDYCYDNDIGKKVLMEYQCVDNKCVSQTVSCPYMSDACSEGACWQLE